MRYKNYIRELANEEKLGSKFRPAILNTGEKPAFQWLTMVEKTMVNAKNGKADCAVNATTLKLFKFNSSNERDEFFSKAGV